MLIGIYKSVTHPISYQIDDTLVFFVENQNQFHIKLQMYGNSMIMERFFTKWVRIFSVFLSKISIGQHDIVAFGEDDSEYCSYI